MWRRAVFFVLLSVVVLSSARTLRKRHRKRDAISAGIMINDEAYSDYGSGIDWLNDFLTLEFRMTYDKPFNDELLIPGSYTYEDEVQRLKRYLAEQTARNVGIIEEDVKVEIFSFSEPQTTADFSVSVPTYFAIYEDELSIAVTDIMQYGDVDGSIIIDVQQIMRDNGPPIAENNVILDIEITYDKDISSGYPDLTNLDSESFQLESNSIQQELALYLVAKLSEMGVLITSEQIKIEVLNFHSVDSYTAVTLSVETKDISQFDLREALDSLAVSDGVGLTGRQIVSIEILSNIDGTDFIYDGNMDYGPITDVMAGKDELTDEHMLLDGDDMTDIVVKGEVMSKEEDNGFSDETVEPDVVVLNGEPTPPEPAVPESDDYEPIPPFPTDEKEPIPPEPTDEKEPIPPEPTDEKEPIPPEPTDEPIPPYPGESPDHCFTVLTPERGTKDCDAGNKIGSHCSFTCEEGTRLEGAESITCDKDGSWSADAPYCIRIFCDPHIVELAGGSSMCSDHNVYGSICLFTCDDHFTLNGEATIECMYEGEWSHAIPTCEADPVVCEEEYGEWTECSGGRRLKEAVMVTRGEKMEMCPEVIEDCVDCEFEWTEWSGCEEGFSTSFMIVTQPKVGAGKDCPDPGIKTEECHDCKIEWGPWGVCESGVRTRSQQVLVKPVGLGAECPPRETETEKCIDCRLEWDEWSACENGVRSRSQFVAQESEGAGEQCSAPQKETEVCIDCVLVWEEWSECIDGERGRAQIVQTPPQGAGKPCGNHKLETEACEDCEVAWGEWGECSGGYRRRSQVVTVEQFGAGRECPTLQTDEEVCIDCELEWGPWGECNFGERERGHFIKVQPVGAGKECPVLEMQIDDCANCVMFWREWSECSGGFRTRQQYVHQQAYNVEEECPEPQTEREECVDCVVAWGPWGECSGEKRVRSEVIETSPVGAGLSCPELRSESEACIDCVVDWGPWSACIDGKRSHTEEIIMFPVGEGSDCPQLSSETEDCQDCVVDWGEWQACSGNERIREQVVVQPRIGGGSACPELARDIEACATCVVEWDPWTRCLNGERTRSQFVLVEPMGVVDPCPELRSESEECVDCVVGWGEWSGCSGQIRRRTQVIEVNAVGAGERCPPLKTETEDCVNCRVEWRRWTPCINNERSRVQYIRIKPVGAGAECPELKEEREECIDCEIEWDEWTECIEGQRSKSQIITQNQVGAGRSCPRLETRVEVCRDCVVEWGPWTDCFQKRRSRKQIVSVQLVGAGKECPPLEREEEECSGLDSDEIMEDVVCKFTENVLGHGRRPQIRDLLLIGDESGSIGWVNYDKIKRAFKAVAGNLRGGIGSQESQIAMMSFGTISRTTFMFDAYHDVIDIKAAIDRAFYRGGYLSKIGGALMNANRWMFQQTAGMRSFPNMEDNNVHEILIATDGCRTSDAYILKKALETIKKRGIKLFVLAVASKDQRCRDTVTSMVDPDSLFMLDDWSDLDKFTDLLEQESCVSRSRADSGDTVEAFPDGDDEEVVET